MASNKPRVIKDFDKLDNALQEQIKLVYPYGFYRALIKYTDKNGAIRSALPFETDDKYYLIRMTQTEAKNIIEEDDDYTDSGKLREGIREDYEEKYGDLDYLEDQLPD